MRKIKYNLALFILHKNVKPIHFHKLIEKEVIIYNQKTIISWFSKI